MSTREAAPVRRKGSRTYLPEQDTQAELAQFADVFRHWERQFEPGAKLVAPDGRATPIPNEIFELLQQVATSLAAGQGVAVVPVESLLTTQEAADYLGISRPTLVRLLEGGAITYETRGRHRRVLLRDLIEYQDRMRVERRSALDEIARAGQAEHRYRLEESDRAERNED